MPERIQSPFHDSFLQGARITVMGLGRFGGGIGVTRFLTARGAQVRVTDRDPASALAASVAQIQPLIDAGRVNLRLGEHVAEDFIHADGVIASPAVDPKNPLLAAARAAGVPVSSEIRLLCSRLPCRKHVIGITGSAGKSTTTALLGAGLQSALAARGGGQKTWVGGNLGGSLLDSIHLIRPEDWVVLELSSFMLESLDEDRFSPGLALWTNLAPNHLDRHGTLDAYAHAKSAIFRHQHPGDLLLTGPGLVERTRIAPNAAREICCAPATWEALGSATDGFHLPGSHNRQNALLAAETLKAALDIPLPEALDHLKHFQGLPHRLAFVTRRDGIAWYNDSKSTTPEATLLALAAFPARSVHMIVGGRDKGANLAALCQGLTDGAVATYTLGEMGDTVANQVVALGGHAVRCHTLDEAVRAARRAARPGEAIVLSPAFASWDQFPNYEARGARFIALATATTL